VAEHYIRVGEGWIVRPRHHGIKGYNIIAGNNIQRVNHFDVQWAVTGYIFSRVGYRVIRAAISIVGTGRWLTEDLIRCRLIQDKDLPSVALSLYPCDRRTLSILGVGDIIKRNVWNPCIGFQVTPPGEVWYFLPEKLIGVTLVIRGKHIVCIGNSHVIILLMVDERQVFCGKSIFCNDERMDNALVCSVNHDRTDVSAEVGAVFPVHKLCDTIFNITLIDQPGLCGILKVRSTYSSIFQLEYLVSFKTVK